MNNALIHYGVLGMKWGVRRSEAQLARARGKRAKETNKETIKNMSDEDLRKKVNRLQLERQYSQLSQSEINKGKEYVKKIVKAGTTVAAVTTTALTLHSNANKIKDIIGKAKKG